MPGIILSAVAVEILHCPTPVLAFFGPQSVRHLQTVIIGHMLEGISKQKVSKQSFLAR